MFRSAKGCLILSAWFVASCAAESKQQEQGACVVARHVDQCCSAPVPASTEQMSKDACLQLVQRKADVTLCSAVAQCNKVACASLPAPSRVAARNGDSCVYVNECESDSDCVLATNEAFCCGCPEWVPRGLLASDPCWSTASQPVASECDVCPAASETACGACPTPAGAARCVDGGNGYKQCLGQ